MPPATPGPTQQAQTPAGTVRSATAVSIHDDRYVDLAIVLEGAAGPPVVGRVGATDCPDSLMPGERVSVRFTMGVMVRGASEVEQLGACLRSSGEHLVGAPVVGRVGAADCPDPLMPMVRAAREAGQLSADQVRPAIRAASPDPKKPRASLQVTGS